MVDISSVLSRPAYAPSVVDCEREFLHELQDYGLEVRELKDGVLTRVTDTQHHKKRSDAGWYVFHGDHGAFGSWFRGDKQTWTPRHVEHMSPADRAHWEQRVAADRERLEADLAQQHEDAAAMAVAIYGQCDGTFLTSSYHEAKGIVPAPGIKFRASDNNVVVPVQDIEGKIMSLQFIAPDGGKKFLQGGKAGGGMFPIGDPVTASVIYVAEGYATAVTIHDATGECCYVAFSAHNLAPVVGALREKFPKQRIVICGDNDSKADGSNPGREAAQDAAAKHGVDYCIPNMPGDFNDLAAEAGIDAVLSLLPKAKPSLKPVPFDPQAAIPPRPWLFGDQLIKGYVSVLVAPPGVGKSTFTIQVGIAVAMGMDWADWTCHEQGNVWLFNNEDDRHELYRRVHASCLNMGVAAADLEGRLFINTGDERALKIARGSRDQVWLEPDIDECISYIRDNDIKLFIVDPFAETHTVNENSNDEIKQVAVEFRRIAKETGCAVCLVHHTRKGNGLDMGGNMDAGRGASALNGVARVAATLFSMRKDEATDYGLDQEEAHLYVRHDGAKANLSLVTHKAKWFKRDSAQIANGEWVGVLMPHEFVDIFDTWSKENLKELVERVRQRWAQSAAEENQQKTLKDPTRKFPFNTSPRSDDWVGHVIGELLRVPVNKAGPKKKAESLLHGFFSEEPAVLQIEPGKNKESKDVEFVRPGAAIL